jgi:monodehydroascorbate reductase (NADH)
MATAATARADADAARPIVVVGAGNSAGYFARAAVAAGRGADLLILGGEPYAPYERPALSKAYLAPENPARLPGFHTCVGGGGERQDAEWYKQQGIDLRLGCCVKKVDVASKSVTWIDSDGAEKQTTFERLVLATGARPVSLAADFSTPGADLPGVLALRGVADADALLREVSAAAAAAAARGNNKPAEVVVVGGGYVGVEVSSAICQHKSVRATMVLPEPSVLARIVPVSMAAFYERQLEARGVAIVKGRAAVAFEAAEGKAGQEAGPRVGFAVLNEGPEGPRRLPCDVVVVGAGARPNVDLAREAGIALAPAPPNGPGGVQVDAHLRSVSHPFIYAIGDVAAVPMRAPGSAAASLARQEHVQFARESAAFCAAAVLAPSGENPTGPFSYLPYFYSRIFDLSWVFYGSSPSAADGGSFVAFGSDDPATAPAPGKAKFGAYWCKEGKVVGAFLEGGDAAEVAAVRAVVAGGAAVPEAGGTAELASQGLGFATAYAAAAKL